MQSNTCSNSPELSRVSHASIMCALGTFDTIFIQWGSCETQEMPGNAMCPGACMHMTLSENCASGAAVHPLWGTGFRFRDCPFSVRGSLAAVADSIAVSGGICRTPSSCMPLIESPENIPRCMVVPSSISSQCQWLSCVAAYRLDAGVDLPGSRRVVTLARGVFNDVLGVVKDTAGHVICTADQRQVPAVSFTSVRKSLKSPVERVRCGSLEHPRPMQSAIQHKAALCKLYSCIAAALIKCICYV